VVRVLLEVIEPSFSTKLRDDLLRRGWIVWAVNEPWIEGNSVYIDQERSGYLATRFLIEKKSCRRIAFLNGPPEEYWGFGAKLKGYRMAMEEAGIEADPQLMRERTSMVDTEAGRMMMRSLLSENADMDGVVAASDLKALGAVAAAQEAGRTVPTDIAIIGIDDIFAVRCSPPIPSVAMPFEDVGRRAAEEAIRSAGSPTPHRSSSAEIQLKPTLVER
jgi:DNA-binding LacI/PurR family transcriptional regulator